MERGADALRRFTVPTAVVELFADEVRGRGFNPGALPDDFDFLLKGVIDSLSVLQMIGELEKRFPHGVPLPPNTEGLLLVKGPNRMLGYLNNPGLTNSVLRDGWLYTGDIARRDADGFYVIVRVKDSIPGAIKEIEKINIFTSKT